MRCLGDRQHFFFVRPSGPIPVSSILGTCLFEIDIWKGKGMTHFFAARRVDFSYWHNCLTVSSIAWGGMHHALELPWSMFNQGLEWNFVLTLRATFDFDFGSYRTWFCRESFPVHITGHRVSSCLPYEQKWYKKTSIKKLSWQAGSTLDETLERVRSIYVNLNEFDKVYFTS